MIIAIFSLLFLFNSCTKSTIKQDELSFYSRQKNSDTLSSIGKIDEFKNKDAFIIGKLQKFTPWTEGKGANHMFWDWEVSFRGGGAIPLIEKKKAGGDKINFAEYENRNVIIYGTVFFGTIIGDDNEGHQSASGWRIDAIGISFAEDNLMQNLKLDTCRLWGDIESNWNKDAYVVGRIIEYVPPRDNSKLGDEKIWDWELVTIDNYSIPLISQNRNLDVNSYIGKNVILKAFIKYGIIFGSENTANMQGTRIDAQEIYVMESLDPLSKISLDLKQFNDDGYRERPKGEFSSTNYEFCIPGNDETAKEVMAIDPTIGVYKTSKGRSGCTDKEWLCIGSTRQANFKNVILKLASLSYIRKISETFWE